MYSSCLFVPHEGVTLTPIFTMLDNAPWSVIYFQVEVSGFRSGQQRLADGTSGVFAAAGKSLARYAKIRTADHYLLFMLANALRFNPGIKAFFYIATEQELQLPTDSGLIMDCELAVSEPFLCAWDTGLNSPRYWFVSCMTDLLFKNQLARLQQLFGEARVIGCKQVG